MDFRFFFRNIFIVFVFFFSFAFSKHSSAQSNYEDVVYLKNGSIIHGMIIEQIPNESIKIKSGESIFVFKMSEVEKTVKEKQKVTSGENAKEKNERKIKGFTNITEMSFAISLKKAYSSVESDGNYSESTFDEIHNHPTIGMQTINGYQFNPYFSAGAGIGLQANWSLFLVPIFLDLRTTFMNKRLSPFAVCEIGSSFTREQIRGNSSANTNHEGGLMSVIAGGVKFFPVPEMALNLSLGWRCQKLKVQADGPDAYGHSFYDKKTLNQFTIRFGFTF
jgi:hypothetical protein